MPTVTRSKRRRDKTGRFIPSSIDSKGYLTIKAGPCRDMRVHTLVAEAMLGRSLRKDEQVHHKDEDKLNCHWKNLIVLDKSTHGFLSSKQRWFVQKKIHDFERWQWEQALKEAAREAGVTGESKHDGKRKRTEFNYGSNIALRNGKK